MRNKRGQLTLMLIFFVVASVLVMLVLGLTSWIFGMVDDELQVIDFQLGNQSWNETYNQGLGLGIEAASTTGPQIISMGLLFGMIIAMMFVGYYAGAKSKFWIMLDIAILIVVEILANVLVFSFYKLMNITPELLDVYSTTLSFGSKFVIALPQIVPIVGILIMIMTNIVNKMRKKEDPVRF